MWNQKCYYSVNESPQPVSILSQMNPIRTPIVYHRRLRFSSCLFPSGLPTNILCAFLSPRDLYGLVFLIVSSLLTVIYLYVFCFNLLWDTDIKQSFLCWCLYECWGQKCDWSQMSGVAVAVRLTGGSRNNAGVRHCKRFILKIVLCLSLNVKSQWSRIINTLFQTEVLCDTLQIETDMLILNFIKTRIMFTEICVLLVGQGSAWFLFFLGLLIYSLFKIWK